MMKGEIKVVKQFIVVVVIPQVFKTHPFYACGFLVISSDTKNFKHNIILINYFKMLLMHDSLLKYLYFVTLLDLALLRLSLAFPLYFAPSKLLHI